MNLDAPSPVFDFLPRTSLVDYSGHIAAVFFTSGCNFACGYCHNRELMRHGNTRHTWRHLARACRLFQENWAGAAVVTGGEPTVSHDLPELLTFLRGVGWRIKLDTNGSNPAMLRRCLPMVDYVAMDIKASPERYPELTGFRHTENLLESVEMLKEGRVDYEFRTTVIEPFHTDEEMEKIASWVKGARRYVLQPFVPRDSIADPGYAASPRTSAKRMQALRERFAGVTEQVLAHS